MYKIQIKKILVIAIVIFCVSLNVKADTVSGGGYVVSQQIAPITGNLSGGGYIVGQAGHTMGGLLQSLNYISSNSIGLPAVSTTTTSSSGGGAVILPKKEVTQVSTVVEMSCPYFNSYLKLGSRGDEVKKVQRFLNTNQGEKLVVTGYFGTTTHNAVKRFQKKYSSGVLSVWRINVPTGWWYQSTRAKANELMGCKESNVILDNGVRLN